MICSLTEQLASHGWHHHSPTPHPSSTQLSWESLVCLCFMAMIRGQEEPEGGGGRKEKKWNNCRTKCKQTLPFIFHSVKEAQEMQTSEVKSPKGNRFNYTTILPKNLKSN